MARSSRRMLLRVLAGLGAVAAVPPIVHAVAPGGPALDRLDDAVVWYLHDDEIVQAGQAYLAQMPSENSIATLAEKLSTLVEGDGSLRASATAAQAFETARGLVLRDFETQDLLTVNGWFMPRTEARLCALIALLSPNA
jgi:hypothetical protein